MSTFEMRHMYLSKRAQTKRGKGWCADNYCTAKSLLHPGWEGMRIGGTRYPSSMHYPRLNSCGCL